MAEANCDVTDVTVTGADGVAALCAQAEADNNTVKSKKVAGRITS